jgi:transposase InsO family protein
MSTRLSAGRVPAIYEFIKAHQHQLIRLNGLRALHGHRTLRRSVGKPSVLIPDILQRQFTVTRRNRAWVTDITYKGCRESVGVSQGSP